MTMTIIMATNDNDDDHNDDMNGVHATSPTHPEFLSMCTACSMVVLYNEFTLFHVPRKDR